MAQLRDTHGCFLEVSFLVHQVQAFDDEVPELRMTEINSVEAVDEPVSYEYCERGPEQYSRFVGTQKWHQEFLLHILSARAVSAKCLIEREDLGYDFMLSVGHRIHRDKHHKDGKSGQEADRWVWKVPPNDGVSDDEGAEADCSSEMEGEGLEDEHVGPRGPVDSTADD